MDVPPYTRMMMDSTAGAGANNAAYQHQEKCPSSCNVPPASSTNKT